MQRLPNNVVWAPIPGSSQEFALDSRAQVTLFTGARGPGKTDTQLMRFRKRVGIGYGAYWRGVIFDREYKNLDDLVSKSKRWFPSFEDKCKFLESKADYKWVWPTGEELLFRAIKDPKDYWNYHGQEYPFIGWNELCKFPTLELFDMMFSCNRSSFVPELHAPIDPTTKNRIELPPIPLEVFATTNPYGPGHNAVKKRFIDPAPYGKMVRKTIPLFNPRTQRDEEFTTTQVTIFGSWRENRYLDPQYVANLMAQTDPNQRKAWLEGSWDITAGGVFDDLWRRDWHIIPRIKVPASWYIDRSLDWGSSTPFSYGTWVCANGEEAMLEDGTTFCPPPGTLIQVGEWYGSAEVGTNRGLKLGATEVAENILAYEQSLVSMGYLPRMPSLGPADNSIRNVNEQESDTIEKKMNDAGLYWEVSDKSRGSRIVGVQLMRDRLLSSLNGEGPGIYVTRNCQATIETVPSLPRSETFVEDVDTEAEDHAWDMMRFRVLKGAYEYETHAPVGMPH